MTFIETIKHLGITAEFQTLARSGCGNKAIILWCKCHPQIENHTIIPASFQYVRKKLNCSMPHGGKRGTGNATEVSRMIRRSRNEFEKAER